MIRVMLAEDHHLVRQGLRAVLDKAEEITVVGEAADGQEALELTERLLPDVLVVDLAMPRLNGLETVRRLRGLGGKTRALILSMYADDTLVRQALRHGAHGYLLKRAVSEELLLAVQAVSRGDTFLSPEVTGRSRKKGNIYHIPHSLLPSEMTLCGTPSTKFRRSGRNLTGKDKLP